MINNHCCVFFLLLYLCLCIQLQNFNEGEITELALWCTNGKAMFHVIPAVPSNVTSSSRQQLDEDRSMAVTNEALAAR